MPDFSYSWVFQRLRKSDTQVDPTADEFFATEELRGLSDALVRETIQNSLDARLKADQPVFVRFDLSGIKYPASPQVRDKFLNDLTSHLECQDPRFLDANCLGEEFSFLVIEDFNTNGLTGDETQYKDRPNTDGGKNNFYYFWRNIGRSQKNDGDRGRWGLGKTVYPATSRIHSFFGLTLRADDNRTLLMGQSVLKIHEPVNSGQRYGPYGYFCELDNEDFQLPVEEGPAIDEFSTAFRLERKSDSGLSIVIPFPRREIKSTAIIDSTVFHYFYPILSGELIVDIVDEDGKKTSLNKQTLAPLSSILSSFQSSKDKGNLLKTISLVITALETPSDSLIKVNNSSVQHFLWKDNDFQSDIETLKRSFSDEEIMGFLIPVKVIKTDGSFDVNSFKLFLQHDAELPGGEAHFIRSGLTIPKVGKANAVKSVRALVIVDERVISNLLGDSENPAHTAWEPRRNKVSGKYKSAEATIRYVTNCISEVVKRIATPLEGRDENVLRDVFYIVPEEVDLPPQKSRERNNQEKGDKSPPTPDIDVERKKTSSFRINKLQGGFEIQGIENDNFKFNPVQVKVAYESRKGDAFKLYQPFDFKIGITPIKVASENVEIQSVEDNSFSFLPTTANYSVLVSGFDSNRDLQVKVRTQRASNDQDI